jgi:hypothetical protein
MPKRILRIHNQANGLRVSVRFCAGRERPQGRASPGRSHCYVQNRSICEISFSAGDVRFPDDSQLQWIYRIPGEPWRSPADTVSLSRRIRENDRSLVADFRASSGRAAKVRREPECPRLGGCAGRLRRTSLPQNFPDIRENTGNFDQSCLTG